MGDLISRQALCEYALNQKDKSVTPNDIMRFPSAKPEREIKDCRNCKHGNYNDHWGTYFCYYSGDCNDWDKWEPSAESEYKELQDWKTDFKGFIDDLLYIPRDDYRGIMEYIDEVPSAESVKAYTKADYIMALHKEYGCTLTRAEKAHNKALEYLRSKARMKG